MNKIHAFDKVDEIPKFQAFSLKELSYLSHVINLFPEMFGVIIARLANLSFNQREFPTFYKKAQITTLLRKSNIDPKDPSNLRPISNLSTISKVLEKLFLARISASSSQHIKLERHTTETTLLIIINDIYKNVDNKLGSVLVTLDISAAFDCVVHHTWHTSAGSWTLVWCHWPGFEMDWISPQQSNTVCEITAGGIGYPQFGYWRSTRLLLGTNFILC